jgi:phage baseplate assembly protein W
MAIRLDDIEQDALEQKSLKQGYLYKDIGFDLELSKFNRPELYSSQEPRDLNELQDGRAVVNSVKNILSTTPGQKLLNPLLGMDLRHFLFEPISQTTSYFIAVEIYENLGKQEPRIDLNSVAVTSTPDEYEYVIEIAYSIPALDVYNLSLNATLNKEGYIIV